MFQDLDATLKAILDDLNASADLRAADVSFMTPNKDFIAAQPTVNLFLYEVQENRELRDNAPVVEFVAGQYGFRQPAKRVDCTYLVTAWSDKTAGDKIVDEHKLLGLALLWLGRFPVIPDTYLQGGLKTPPQPYPLGVQVAQMKEDRSLGQFWSALGIAPRPAFSLTVTVALQLFDTVDQYPQVQDGGIHLQVTSSTDPVLSGRVTDPALAPLAGASVTIAGTSQAATTDQQGRFTIGGLAFGAYTLVVAATGRQQQQVPIDFETDRQVHNVILP